jgi:dihydrofolate synthase/folylpolyglutamate synthase
VPIDSYLEALTYFYSYARYDPGDVTRWSLDRLQELLARLGEPHKTFPSLLIAGTKGKGSTAAICESILREAGYNTGLYTSPHLHSFRERIRLGGRLITEDNLVAIANKLKPYFESTSGLTAFELITTVAFVAFADAQVDAAVLEVGLGGRLDATNAVDPAVAVITSISYDHTRILGETLSLIAREKAGIIRPGALVISAPQFDEAMQMIEKVCQERQATLLVVDRDWKWESDGYSLEGQSFSVCGEPYRLPLIGEHQAVNAVTALAAIAGLCRQTDLHVSAEAMSAGVANVRWLGRMEILDRQPYLVIDSAMNGYSSEKLVQTLKQYFAGSKATLIFGASYDHPVSDMLKVLLPYAHKMLVTASSHHRSEKPENLAGLAAELGYEVTPVPDVSTALEMALVDNDRNDLICVTGSLFVVADVREAWLRRNKRALPPIDPQIL